MGNRLPAGGDGPESSRMDLSVRRAARGAADGGAADGGAADIGADLQTIDTWHAGFAAVQVSDRDGRSWAYGDTTKVVRVASLTKLVTAWAVLLGVEEGATTLTEALGPPGCTVEHLLCHAGGLDFDSDQVLAAPGTRRIYSNTGYELLGSHLEAVTGIPFAEYVSEGILEPLGMRSSFLRGSPAKDMYSDVVDMQSFLNEMRAPRVLSSETVSTALSTAMPGLSGVLPGWGPYPRCDWGLGPEIRGSKTPHWTGSLAEAETCGHFGGSGCFLWLDPGTGRGCVVLTDRPFGDWAVALWPGFSDAVRSIR